MPDNSSIPSTLSDLPNDQAVQLRSKRFRNTIRAFSAILAFVVLYTTVLGVAQQVWQMLGIAVLSLLSLVLMRRANQLAKQGVFDAAAVWVITSVTLANLSGILLLNGVAVLVIASGVLTISLGNYLLTPGKWRNALIQISVFVILALAIEWLQPLPRFATAQGPLGGAMSTIVLLLSALVLLWQVVRAFRVGSLRTKLVIAFLTVSLVSMGGVTFYSQSVIRTALQNESSATLSNTAQQQGNLIGALLIKEAELLRTLGLDEAIRTQAALSTASYQGSEADIKSSLLRTDNEWLAAIAAANTTAPLIRSKLDNPLADHLREYRLTYPENVEVFITDRYGALLAATNPTSDFYQADEEWWQAAYNNGQGAVYYAQPAFDDSSHTYSIDIAVPIYESGSRYLTGILRTTLNLNAMVALLDSTHIGQTGHTDLLFPGNGQDVNLSFVTSAGPEEVPQDLVTHLPTQGTTTSIIDLFGEPSFAAVERVKTSDAELGAAIDQLNWKIVAHQSSAEVLAPVEAQTGVVLGVLIFVVIIVATASIGLSYSLMRPIVNLTTTAKKVTQGDLTARASVETSDEIGTLAGTFNTMTAELESMVGSLEERILARTEQLRASGDVGRTAASVLEPDDLLRRVVNLISDRFGFYYVAVFIIESSGRDAVLREATGDAGRILKERGHRLEVNGQSMVGYAITRRRPRIALDVGEDAVHFANPLLPDTRSEISLPLIIGDRVLGALDVQSTQEAAFDDASAAVLQAMADQIAVAWNNALSYAETEAVARRARALFAASRGVSRVQTDLSDTIRDTLRAAAEIMNYERWCVLTFNEIRTALIPIAAHNWPETAQTLDLLEQQTHPLVVCAQQDMELFITDPDDTRLSELQIEDLHNLIGVPIKSRDVLVGLLAVSQAQGSELLEGDLEVGRSLANLIAIAIENHNLLESSERTLRELDEINRTLTGQNWERFVRRQNKQEIMWISYSDRLQPQQLPEVSEALSQGHIATRALEDVRQLGVAVPIKLRDVPVGALHLIVPRRNWNVEMAAALDSIAGHVAQAAENARLIAETEERLMRERALAEATEKVRQHSEVEAVLQTAATELARYLNASHIAVRMTAQIDHAGNGETA